LKDLINGAMQARVDNLHSRISQGFTDDLGSYIMTIQTRLADEHFYWPLWTHISSLG
jgi:hypothetical protein